MPALSFMKRFAPLVESGAKPHTIRDRRKRPIRVGDTLYLYTGMRTKSCRRLGVAECIRAEEIAIDATSRAVQLGSVDLSPEQIAELAIKDGFETVEEFFEFFSSEHERDFIEWILIGDRAS